MAYDTLYMKAISILRDKNIYKDGSITEMKVWKIPVSIQYPFGFRYSFFYVKNGKVLVGYDNHFPKGPHVHYGYEERQYAFKSIDELIKDFEQDVERIKNESEKI
ncbi:hypothetical protein K1X76_01945 [bacterium]|nr:hypothetical protein [bacterium]